MAKFERLLEKVLDNWEGTPEELGATLETAVSLPFTFSRQESEERATARARLFSVKGGKELFKHEYQNRLKD
jgi:hypothetical protein